MYSIEDLLKVEPEDEVEDLSGAGSRHTIEDLLPKPADRDEIRSIEDLFKVDVEERKEVEDILSLEDLLKVEKDEEVGEGSKKDEEDFSMEDLMKEVNVEDGDVDGGLEDRMEGGDEPKEEEAEIVEEDEEEEDTGGSELGYSIYDLLKGVGDKELTEDKKEDDEENSEEVEEESWSMEDLMKEKVVDREEHKPEDDEEAMEDLLKEVDFDEEEDKDKGMKYTTIGDLLGVGNGFSPNNELLQEIDFEDVKDMDHVEEEREKEEVETLFSIEDLMNEVDMGDMIDDFLPDYKKVRKDQNVHLVILCDLTGSMLHIIERVKQTILSINLEMKKIFSNFQMEVSFIGYKDYDYRERFIEMDFEKPERLEEFLETFLQKKKIGGYGIDTCEDVAGGLEKVTQLSFIQDFPTRILIHFADSPGHGVEYHEEGEVCTDVYPKGDPEGKSIEKLLEKIMGELFIHYYFIQVPILVDEYDRRHLTNTMAKKMRDVYENPGGYKGVRMKFHILQYDPSDVDYCLRMFVEAIAESVDSRGSNNQQLERRNLPFSPMNDFVT